MWERGLRALALANNKSLILQLPEGKEQEVSRVPLRMKRVAYVSCDSSLVLDTRDYARRLRSSFFHDRRALA